MATETHTQCKLQRGNSLTVSWIPTRYAVKNSYVKLQDEAGVWIDGWQVLETWTTLPTEVVTARERDWAHQREASDIDRRKTK